MTKAKTKTGLSLARFDAADYLHDRAALAPGAKPRYDTMLKLVQALGVRLHAAAA